MVEWKFVKKYKNQKSREAMQGEFFANSSIDDETHALVREAIQNSLDARVKDNSGPVHVRFGVSCNGALSKETMSKYISEVAWKHFHAKNNGLTDAPSVNDKCHYLVYEDFGTTGLTGDVMQYDFKEGVNNPFYYFMRAEGQSGKSEEDRGRWGVGKFVFPHASNIRSFFMFTNRNDDGQSMMAGQCILKSHEVDNESYTPDGWYGVFDEEDFQLAIKDEEIIEQFQSDFGLERKINQAGLSVVIPYINDEFTLEGIAKHVINEYFYPIIQGQLEVTINNSKLSLFINKGYLLNEDSDELYKPDKETKAMIEMAKHSLEINDDERIELICPEIKGGPNWDESVDAEIANKIRSILDDELKIAAIRIPLYVRKKISTPVNTYFDMYVCRDEHSGDGKPLFIREGIKIPEVHSRAARGYRCLTIIQDKPLATMLGDAENPAHTEWEINSSKFKNKYFWGPPTIEFIRKCLYRLIHVMSQSEEEEDRNVLADIFSIDIQENSDDVPESRRKRRKKPKDGPEEPPTIEPTPPKPRKYKLNKIEGGFCVTGSSDAISTLHTFAVKVAYDRVKGSPWKKYSTRDFEFDFENEESPLMLQAEEIEPVEYIENKLWFKTSNPDFNVSVTGFDKNRDIIVDVKASEVSNETL